MAFTQNTFATVGAHSADTPNLYSYKSTDTLSAVSFPGYFADKKNQLDEGDFILAQLSGYSGLLEVNDTRQGVKIVTDSLMKTAFGELSVAQNDPEIQVNAQYDTSGKVRSVVVAGGTTEITGGEFKASGGTNSGGVGAIFSDRQIIARPGQGAVVRFCARFPQNVADCRQQAGPATALDAMTFGYVGTAFGITYSHGGRVIVEELQITTPAGGAESTTITINGTGLTVPITAGTVEHNAAEIAASLNAQNTIFNFTQNGDTVVCRSVFAAPEAGSFSFSSPGSAVAAWTQISDGIVPTRDFTAQADWNIDTKADLNPVNINYYTVRFNGSIEYFIQDENTGDDVLVHMIKFPNTSTTPMFSIASFRILWSVTNTGNTTDVAMFGSVGSAFSEGEKQSTDASRAQAAINLSVGTTLTNILTIRCREVFGTQVNLGRIIPKSVNGATDGNKGASVEICKNVTFSGDSNFSYIDKAQSIAEIDTTANTVSGGICIAAFVIGAAGSAGLGGINFNDLLLPGDTLTIAMHVPSGASAEMSTSLIWDEDL